MQAQEDTNHTHFQLKRKANTHVKTKIKKLRARATESLFPLSFDFFKSEVDLSKFRSKVSLSFV